MSKPDNLILVIFGASGDLTKRKLLPELYNIHQQKQLPESFCILGVGRTDYNDTSFRKKISEAFKADKKDSELDGFLDKLHYLALDTSSTNDYVKLKERLKALDLEYKTKGNYLFYLATPPSLYPVIPKLLAEQNLNCNTGKCGWKRLVIEKPFGYDLESAKHLNKSLLASFNEEQIYRIDHYRGKETVQNLLVTRFSNGIFEPLWNRNYIERVEITSSESIGVENRGGYYDSSGVLRDMVQNHLLQVTGLIAMEPPSSMAPSAIHNETLKVFQSLRQIQETDVSQYVIRGQYTESTVKGNKVVGYRNEDGVDPKSRTETYVALKFYIDNWRWGGVPFYIRSGKRLPTRVTEVVINFKATPHHLFNRKKNCCSSPGRLACSSCNQLILRIQPDEGIVLKFGMKYPGPGLDVENVNMNFRYADLSDVYHPDPYERLLLDAMKGDSTLFVRGDAAELCWEFLAPIQKAWEQNPDIELYGYPAGTWGPECADDLIDGVHMTWRYPCKNLVGSGEYCEL